MFAQVKEIIISIIKLTDKAFLHFFSQKFFL